MLPLALSGGGLDPLLLLVIALILDALLGGVPLVFRVLPHPVMVVGRAVEAAEVKLNRPRRPEAVRRARGLLLVVTMVAAAAAVGTAVTWLTFNVRNAWVLELILVAALVAQRSLYMHVRAVATALAKGGLAAGRQAVAHIVGRDPTRLDAHGVARAAIESCAENFSDGVVAPVFWYLVAGLPGLLVYKTVNTLDSMIGHRDERYRAFGAAAARLDDVLNLIPARVSGVLLALAGAFVPGAGVGAALRVMLRDHGHHASPNAGWPEAAAAGALGLALGGPRHYAGGGVNEAWMGDGTARASVDDVTRMLSLYAVACLLNFGLVLGALWLASVAGR